MHEGNPSNGTGQQKRSSANCATSGAEVLAGTPFFGGVWRKSEGDDRIYLASIPAEDPLTVDDAFEQIEGFRGTVIISTIIDGEARELTASVGYCSNQLPEPAEPEPSETKQQESGPPTTQTAADVERQLRAAEQECTKLRKALRDERKEHQELEEHYDRRIREMKERHAEQLDLREDRVENERAMRRSMEEDVARLKRDHADEVAELTRRHQDELQRVRQERKSEIERLRAEIERLKDQKNDLYIENRLGGRSKSNLDHILGAVLDNLDNISETFFAGLMKYSERQQGTRNQQAQASALSAASGDGAMNGVASIHASEPHANGQAGSDGSAHAHAPAGGASHATGSQENPSQSAPDAGSEAESNPKGDTPLQKLRSMTRPETLASILGTAVAAVEGKYNRGDFPEALDAVTGVLEERGEPITPEEWAQLVQGLAVQTVEHDLPTEDVAKTIRPIVRRFVKPGSAVETALRTSPASAAATMLIGATGLDPGGEVRDVVVDVLKHYKRTL